MIKKRDNLELTKNKLTKKEITQIIKLISKKILQFNRPLMDQLSLEKSKRDPYKVLISCLLSLRTKDEITEKATAKLFLKIKKPKDLVKLNLSQIEKIIYPVGFYKTKSQRIKNISQELIDNYDSIVPDSLTELLNFKGVGRKTANIVLSHGYDIAAFAVDTHCHRIPNRIGLVNTNVPEETETELIKIIPKSKWIEFGSALVTFGQNICKPIGPKCDLCPITKYCKYYTTVFLINTLIKK
ncbi:endonuclease III [Candidatus Woesearchaeota archaeon]|jgi:endonuclease III|nr:endonuclease III [Candidatus Woesearchaeota archaeon]